VRSTVPLAIAVAIASHAPAAFAQTGRIALDAVASADGDAGSTVRREPGVWFDVFGAVKIAGGLDFLVRPVITRRTFDGAWQKQLYQLAARYERPSDAERSGLGALGIRIEAGQMPSPIGLAMLENRQDLNPVISQHSAYYLPLPRFDSEVPRAFLISGSYPLGAQVTVAGRRWDARAAVIDSSPVRGRNAFNNNSQPRMANWVAGFGFTPTIGLRVGAAFAHGPYLKASELTRRVGGDRYASVLQMEGEWSFGYTRIAGEFVRGSMETSRVRDIATKGAWIETTQTLRPRLFIAGRADWQEVDYATAYIRSAAQVYHRYEAVAGLRLSPDLTARFGYMTRKGYVVFHWDDQFLASVTWQKRVF
jgi:hypothetical protein